MLGVIAFIVGFFVIGLLGSGGQIYLIGGIIGYLILQIIQLKSKMSNLEQRLMDDSKLHEDTPTQESDGEEKLDLPKFLHAKTSETTLANNYSQLKSSDSIGTDNELSSTLHNDESLPPPDKYAHIQKIATGENQDIEHSKEVVDKEPSAFANALLQAKSIVVGYFTGGNSLVRAGMLVLFIGVAFLLKYVSERTVIPVEYRYIAIGFGCLVMLVLGWRLRKKRPGFALSLEGGSIGLLYITLFAALRLHGLLSPEVVFFLLIAIVLLAATLAILQDSMPLIVIGVLGGFAAPILTSTGSGSHVQLFSYYLLLNIGIFAIAWFKSWRALNLIGFVATFGIGSIWGYKFYKPEFFTSVEPFLVAYFLLYTFIAVLFALKQPAKLKGINDGSIIFGTPLVGFALQAALLQGSEYGLAYSALALGVFYTLFAYIIHLMKKPYMQNLIESFVALGLGFATLAIPLSFDGKVTSAMWAVEGCALVWVGIRQSRILPRFSGYALTILGMGAFFLEASSSNLIVWLNSDYIGVLLLCLSTAFIALYARKHSNKLLPVEKNWIPAIMIVFSVIWWVYGGVFEIITHYSTNRFVILELFLAVTSISMLYFADRINFNLVKVLSIVVSFIMILPVLNVPYSHSTLPIFFNVPFVGLFIYSVTHLFMSWFWQRNKSLANISTPIKISHIMWLLGMCAWIYTGHNEIDVYLSQQYFISMSLVFMSVSFVLWLLLARKLNWGSMYYVRYLFVPYLLIVSFYTLVNNYQFHDGFGLYSWLLAALANYWILKLSDNSDMQYKNIYHLVSLLLFVFISVFEFNELAKFILGVGNIWHHMAVTLIVLLISISLYKIRNTQLWPFSKYTEVYFQQGLMVLVSVVWLMIVFVNLLPPGKATIINYLPILNIIDLVGIVFIVFVWKLLANNTLNLAKYKNIILNISIPATAFLMLNASMLRTFHYWLNIEYEFTTMISSFIIQSAFSIMWSLTAVILMVLASKKSWRIVWLAGLGLMIVVVVKLFLVDMSASGTVARIVAFLSVGLLLSLVGYFSPLPPDADKAIQSVKEPRI